MTYQMRAYRYLQTMFGFVHDWTNFYSLQEALRETYFCIGEEATLENGSSRRVIVGEDFVIKWDYDDEAVEEIGGCEDEFRKYKISLSSGYAYLLAPIFRLYYRGRFFFVMPRADGVGSGEDIFAYLSDEEADWLMAHVGDLHSWNWGMLNGKPIVIDYACRADY